jgi:hypothetical protein
VHQIAVDIKREQIILNTYNGKTQKSICARFGSTFIPSRGSFKVGISSNLLSHAWKYPLNGLRHIPTGDTSGWYIWAGSGELSQADNYFKPLHIEHLPEYCPEVLPYLGLAPGWRFLLAPDHEDVWFDQMLFNEDCMRK